MIAKIVIASTLKPIWDPRAYEKIGKTLAHSGLYSVDIIGSGQVEEEDDRINFHAHGGGNSLIKRLLLPLKILSIILKIKPDVLIIGTHELLSIGVFYKLFYSKKFIYDIRENYNFNLRYQKIYPYVIREFLAAYIRSKELIFKKTIDFYFVAENCYFDEMKFLNKRPCKSVLLENKCLIKSGLREDHKDDKIHLLLSGTISELYGVIDALEYCKQLPTENYKITVIGHCPIEQLKDRIEEEYRHYEHIKIILSKNPIPHQQILKSYTTRTVGLLPYKFNKSTQNKVPTKLYEYIGNGIPVLITANKTWKNYLDISSGGIEIDFSLPPNNQDISISYNLKSPMKDIDLQDFMWISNEYKLLASIASVLEN